MINVAKMFTYPRALRPCFSAVAKLLFCIACILIDSALYAQTASNTEEAKPAADKAALQLSKFEVTSTRDRGFIYNNSVGAFRTNQSLMDIPQIDIVVTRDMLNAIQFTNSSDALTYFGMPKYYAGEQMYLRGGLVLPFQDDMPMGNQPYADNGVIDSYEIIKGAAQVLYLSNAIQGVVLKHTKKPLPYASNEIQTTINSSGSIRALVDSTGPAATLGDAAISYRFTGIADKARPYFNNLKEDHVLTMPQLQVDFKNTTIRAYYLRTHIIHAANINGLVTPDGDLYQPTGGYKYAAGLVKNSMEAHDANMGYISITTRLSDTWHNNFKGAFRNSHRYGSNVLPLTLNWDTRIAGYSARLLDIVRSDTTVMDDIQGSYNLGKTEHIDAIGFIFDNTVGQSAIWSGATTLPSTSIWSAPVNMSVDNVQGIANLVAPATSEYDGTKNKKLRSRSNLTSLLAYYAHSVNVNKYLTFTGGVSWAKTDASSIPNMSVLPWAPANNVVGSQLLHRYGVVLKPTNEISIYALESTTFTAATGTQLLQNGSIPPNQSGKNREIGIKTALFGNKVNLNFSAFDMTIAGLLQLGGFDSNGVGYWVANAMTQSKGWDANLGLNIVPGWQIVATYFHTEVSLAYKQPMSTWSAFTNYEFSKKSPLYGFAIGGGVSHLAGQYVPLSGIWKGTLTPTQSSSGFIKLKIGTPVKLFATYRYNSHWLFRLACDNALDEIYPTSTQIPTAMEPPEPRTFSFETTYKF